MTPEEREHVEKLLETNKRRLRVLELQEAQFGLHTPAHLTLEIADLKKEIEKLSKQLEKLSKQLGGATPTPKPDTTSTTIPTEQRQLSATERRRLHTLLLNMPSFDNPNIRESMLQELDSSIRNSIIRSSNATAEAANIIRAVLNYPDGLNSLLEALRVFDEGKIQMAEFENYVKSLR